VVEISRKVEQRRRAGISDEEIRGMARRLMNIFVALNDYDRARDIRKTFELKEAL
jgi:GC-rich sequence DNA-binding factor